MKATIALVAIIAFFGIASAMPLDAEFQSWKSTHGRVYNGFQEELHRRAVWEKNRQLVLQHNSENHSFKLGMNRFADLEYSEFAQQFLGFSQDFSGKVNGSTFIPARVGDLPASVDWRTSGIVTPVKDQGQCGSCWAFSTVASLEGQHARKSGTLVSLSEQNLVDCSGSYGNQGCNGGLMDQAFQYIKANNGIDTEASYPYTAQDGTCKFNSANVGATCTGYVDVTSGSEDALQNAVATIGPISVAIDASSYKFQLYTSGVYDVKTCSSTQLDHGVTAVGYGSDGSTPYWLVKNSWGTSWGQQGYIWMSRNKNNQCGIATSASYPLV